MCLAEFLYGACILRVKAAVFRKKRSGLPASDHNDRLAGRVFGTLFNSLHSHGEEFDVIPWRVLDPCGDGEYALRGETVHAQPYCFFSKKIVFVERVNTGRRGSLGLHEADLYEIKMLFSSL